MIPLPIRGDKTHVRILENGQQIAWAELQNISHNETSQYIEHNLIGEKKPRVDVLMMGFEGQINGLVTNPQIDMLIQRIRDARKSGVNLPQINIMYVEQYPGTEGSKTFVFEDVQLMLANRTAGGANEPVAKTISFKASDFRIL